MKYYTYIIQSLKNGRFYIGQTQNLSKRFEIHNLGKSKYTSKCTPWILIWYKEFDNRKEAFALEQKLKKFKSRKKIIAFINENPCVTGSENLPISDWIDFRESS